MHIQGDSPSPPKKEKKKNEPISFFITSTNIKQMYSNFVHSKICLCMIIPKGVSHLGRFAQKLWCLLDMIQMTSPHWKPQQLREIINHQHSLLWCFPDICYNCSLEFTNCLWIVLIHLVHQIPPQIKIRGFISGERGAHLMPGGHLKHILERP